MVERWIGWLFLLPLFQYVWICGSERRNKIIPSQIKLMLAIASDFLFYYLYWATFTLGFLWGYYNIFELLLMPHWFLPDSGHSCRFRCHSSGIYQTNFWNFVIPVFTPEQSPEWNGTGMQWPEWTLKIAKYGKFCILRWKIAIKLKKKIGMVWWCWGTVHMVCAHFQIWYLMQI